MNGIMFLLFVMCARTLDSTLIFIPSQNKISGAPPLRVTDKILSFLFSAVIASYSYASQKTARSTADVSVN